MSETPLRLGLVGCGHIVLEGHLDAYSVIGDLGRVWALADPSATQREQVGQRLAVPVERRYDYAVDMLARESLDAVVVATPPASHLPAIQTALAADCSVLCEKPLCRDLGELREVERAVGRRRGSVAVLHNYLYHPGWRELIQRVRRGEVGRPRLVRFVELSRGHWGARSGSWRERADLGGGPLRDNLYHVIYLCEAITNSPAVGGWAKTSQLLRDYPVGDLAMLVLQHGSGAVTMALASWCHAGRSVAEVEVGGSTAVLRYRYWEEPLTLQIERSDEGSRCLSVTGRGSPDENGYLAAFRAWLEALIERRPPPCGLQEARRVLEVLAKLAPLPGDEAALTCASSRAASAGGAP